MSLHYTPIEWPASNTGQLDQPALVVRQINWSASIEHLDNFHIAGRPEASAQGCQGVGGKEPCVHCTTYTSCSTFFF